MHVCWVQGKKWARHRIYLIGSGGVSVPVMLYNMGDIKLIPIDPIRCLILLTEDRRIFSANRLNGELHLPGLCFDH
jgi:hypothetical protein